MYLFWIIDDDSYLFVLDADKNKYSNYVYRKLIDKEGFNINMLGNISNYWYNNPQVEFTESQNEMMYKFNFDNVSFRRYFDVIGEPKLIDFKKQIIEYIDDIYDNWI